MLLSMSLATESVIPECIQMGGAKHAVATCALVTQMLDAAEHVAACD